MPQKSPVERDEGVDGANAGRTEALSSPHRANHRFDLFHLRVGEAECSCHIRDLFSVGWLLRDAVRLLASGEAKFTNVLDVPAQRGALPDGEAERTA